MDKKNTTIGVLLLVAAFASMYLTQRLSPSKTPAPVPTVNTPAASNPGNSAPATAPTTTAQPGTTSAAPTTAFAAAVTENRDAKIVTREND